MNWIQKHALGVLMRYEQTSLKQMRPDGVDANLFSYHIHYLKTNNIIKSVSRGRYSLTPHGMHVAGKFNSATINQVEDVKTIIVLHVTDGDNVLLLKWSRHPYLGYYTLPHDRYTYGASLDEALAEALQDKLHITAEKASPRYLKSGIMHIMHDSEEISCMSAHVYRVDAGAVVAPRHTRNGTIDWVSTATVETRDDVMVGVGDLLSAIGDPRVDIFDVTLSY